MATDLVSILNNLLWFFIVIIFTLLIINAIGYFCYLISEELKSKKKNNEIIQRIVDNKKAEEGSKMCDDGLIPLFVVYDEETEEIFEQGFSLEAMEYYAGQRENCSVGMMMVNETDLEETE